MLKEMIKLKSFLIMKKSNSILTLFIKSHQVIINILNHRNKGVGSSFLTEFTEEWRMKTWPSWVLIE